VDFAIGTFSILRTHSVAAGVRVALVLLTLAAALSAQQAAAPPAGVHDRDTLVRLDAFVLDARSRPLENLTAADFEIHEDGVPATVEAARFVSAAATPRLVGVYLDEYHLSEASAEGIREQLRRFVERDLDARDRLVVLKPLDSLLAISIDSDREASLNAIARVAGRKGDYAPTDAYERQYMAKVPPAIDLARAQITASGLNALAVRLGQADRDARKTLIVVSEGLGGPLDTRRRSSLPTIDTIIQSANRANVSVYAIDPQDDPAHGDGGAMARLAAETDGLSIRGPAALHDAFKRIAADSGGYYLISYRSPGKTDNRFHAVQLRARRPGATVRARAGYWPASPDDLLGADAPANPPRAAESAEPLRISRLIRPWFGLSRGTGGHTRVTFVWEPAPGVPGERARPAPTRLRFTALTPDRTEVFDGTVFPVGSIAFTDGAASNRAVFEVPPGRVRVRMSIQDAGQQEIDSDVRDVAVSDLAAPVAIGTPEILRLRTAREFRALESNLQAPPVAARSFSRTERLLIRVRTYADADAIVSATLMTPLGRHMRTLTVAAPSVPGGPNQVDLPLAGLASADYRIEFRVESAAGEARESVSFRVTP
jgi:VWFA-related protein